MMRSGLPMGLDIRMFWHLASTNTTDVPLPEGPFPMYIPHIHSRSVVLRHWGRGGC